MNNQDIQNAVTEALKEASTERQQEIVGRKVRRIMRRLMYERENGCREHLFTSDEAVLIIVALNYAANGLLGLQGEIANQLSLARAMGGKNDTLLVVEEAQD